MDFISTSSSKQHIEQYFSTGDLRKSDLIYMIIASVIDINLFSAVDRRGGSSN